MRLFTRTVTIAKPREAVFDFFVDFTQASRWRQSVKTMEPVTPGPLRAGTVIRTIFDVAGDDLTLDLEVAACERPSLWRHTVDEHDFHKVGLSEEFAMIYLRQAGFRTARRVGNFGLFDDTSGKEFMGVPISLNVEAVK